MKEKFLLRLVIGFMTVFFMPHFRLKEYFTNYKCAILRAHNIEYPEYIKYSPRKMFDKLGDANKFFFPYFGKRFYCKIN